MEPVVPELPASRADLEEEEEQHEHQARTDVEHQTQAHVHAGEPQDPPSGSRMEPDRVLGSPALHLRHSSCHRRGPGSRQLWLALPLLQCLDSTLGFLEDLRRSRGGRVALGLREVARREVGGAVVSSEEGQHLLLVPGVDALHLLVAGGAEGRAGPGGFGERRVITEGTCKNTVVKR